MARRQPQNVPGRLPGALTIPAILLLLAAIVTPAWAGPPGPGGPGGWFDPNDPGGYQVGAVQPGTTGSQTTGTAPTGGSSDNTGDGCIVDAGLMLCPKCADPLGTGICNAPAAAAPAISPAQLAVQTWNTLQLPVPDVATAPPRGSQGLVGLPEWVWVPPAQWQPLTKTATAGAVWATVTATPKQMTLTPGASLAPVACDGPGNAYNPALPATAQHTDCSYTYTQSSATQPGAAYQVTVTVVWGGTWTGSGGTGGALPDIARTTTFGVRVAEAEGLYG